MISTNTSEKRAVYYKNQAARLSDAPKKHMEALTEEADELRS